jgi:hypothetical protein
MPAGGVLGQEVGFSGAGNVREGRGRPSVATHGSSGLESDGLQFAYDPVELAHVAGPLQAACGLLRGELGGNGLARHLSGPEVVGAVEPGRGRLAAAGGLPAARHAPGDRATQHQAEVGQFGNQGAVTDLEALQRRTEGGCIFPPFFC